MTPRETEIAMLIAQAKTNRQVALECGISEQTVKNHVWRIMEKLDCSSRVGIAVKYVGLLNNGAGI